MRAPRRPPPRRAEHDDARRRQAEKRHAQEIVRISQPVVRYVHEVRTIPSPKPEVLRVLYLTANPELDLRTEVEVRDVRQAVRAATHRDLIDIIPLDNASIESPAGREVTFDLLAKALGATGDPPVPLVLNDCDTLDGAEVLLEFTPVIIAMASDITDLAASVFAARFYSAIASAQPVGAAVRQGSVAMEFAGTHEGGSPPYSLATMWSWTSWCWSRSHLSDGDHPLTLTACADRREGSHAG
jgi:hypothetical protein